MTCAEVAYITFTSPILNAAKILKFSGLSALDGARLGRRESLQGFPAPTRNKIVQLDVVRLKGTRSLKTFLFCPIRCRATRKLLWHP